jgi:hypothetical protein
MSGQITISIWLFLFLIAFAVWAILDGVLIPSTRWFLRRRINRVIDEIGTRLDIKIKPFQITLRQVLGICRYLPGFHGGVCDEPSQQYGIHPGGISGSGKNRAFLCRWGMGENLAPTNPDSGHGSLFCSLQIRQSIVATST